MRKKGSDKVAKRKESVNSSDIKKGRPALTPEARENQLISLAIDLVEERLRNGTASSQETTHFLKLGSTTARMEKEKLRLETELVKAKTSQINSSESSEKLYSEAIKAFQKYSGSAVIEEESPDDY